MNQEKVSELIKSLRKNNNLTQEAFAKEFGVSYQAVSKWENGKNLPDINVLKEICDKYNLDINDFLSGTLKKKKNHKKFIVIGIVILTIMISTFLVIHSINKKDDFEFKHLHTTCENFNITGVVAYNNVKSSIYISELSYCGKKEDTLYKFINCTLYETTGDVNKKISSYEDYKADGIMLDDFLKNVKFSVDNYDKICKTYDDDNLYLEIRATDFNDKINTYHVPLDLDDNCSK